MAQDLDAMRKELAETISTRRDNVKRRRTVYPDMGDRELLHEYAWRTERFVQTIAGIQKELVPLPKDENVYQAVHGSSVLRPLSDDLYFYRDKSYGCNTVQGPFVQAMTALCVRLQWQRCGETSQALKVDIRHLPNWVLVAFRFTPEIEQAVLEAEYLEQKWNPDRWHPDVRTPHNICPKNEELEKQLREARNVFYHLLTLDPAFAVLQKLSTQDDARWNELGEKHKYI